MGLAINLSKTKIMTNIGNLETIKINGEHIERIIDYKYLGQTLDFDNKMEKELKNRKANTWKAFWLLSSIPESKMKLKIKIKILERSVNPVQLYGAQTLSMIEKQIQKTQNSKLRSILQVRLKKKTTVADMFAKTKAKNSGVVAKKLNTSRYAGHIIGDQKYVQMEQNPDNLGSTH